MEQYSWQTISFACDMSELIESCSKDPLTWLASEYGTSGTYFTQESLCLFVQCIHQSHISSNVHDNLIDRQDNHMLLIESSFRIC